MFVSLVIAAFVLNAQNADVEAMRGMIGMFEKKDALLELVASDAAEEGVQVYIGSENAVDVMIQSTLVYRQIRRGGRVVGAIGVIGPCRMNYSKVIETIDRLAESVDRAINEGDE